MIDGGMTMKKHLLTFTFFLAACSTQPIQATVTPATTATLPPPTATIIPTPTSSPEFLAIQEQVAGSAEYYSIMGNGNIEGKLSDGTIGVISGITLNRDGQNYTLTVNGEKILIDASKVEINDAGIYVEGYVYDTTTGMFIEGFNIEAWAGTDPNRLEFVANMNEWNADPASYACGQDGICKDNQGNIIFDAKTGEFNLDFLLETIPPGNLEQTNYAPVNGFRKDNPPNFGSYVKDTLMDHQDYFNGFFSGGHTSISGLLLHDLGAGKYAWGFVISGKDGEGKARSYLVFNNQNHDLSSRS